MSAKKCAKHGKPFPCGPCRIESSKRPPQAPALPLQQLIPTANELNVVSDAFGLVRREKPKLTVKRKKKIAPRTPTPREQYNLTRRDVVELLDKSGVEAALNSTEVHRYRDLAAGNLSEKDLATQIGMKEEIGVGVYITDLETRIIRKALLLGIRLQPQTRVETDTFDRTMDADRGADERDIATSEGASIGGSIISRGSGKPLDSFEHGGKIRTLTGSSPDRDFTGGDADLGDNYSEDSTA